MPVISAGYLPGDTASHLVASCALGHVAALYALDIGSDSGGICGALPERMASGVAKEPADFFGDFFILRYIWSGFGGGRYAVGGRMLNCGPDESDGRQLAIRA